MNLPTLPEQTRIADFFTKLDSYIEQQELEVEKLKEQKKGFMQKIFSQEIRFKDENGEDFPDWEEKKIKDCLKYEQPTKYIVGTTEYNEQGAIPVLTANKSFILGYTNESEGIYNKGDAILYDDFTMDMKYVNFEFKVKSSAIKILTALPNYNLYCVYNLLKGLNLHQKEHVRSYISQVEKKKINLPTLPEQTRIADFFTKLDEEIEVEQAILEKWKLLKKGFLQQMFI